MSERTLRGLAASSGLAVGPAVVWGAGEDAGTRGTSTFNPSEVESALAALTRVAAELGDEAARLRAAGREDEASIFEASQLMAEDPGLRDDVRASAPTAGAIRSITAATERHALALAALPDPDLAARAADVRAVGRRAARVLAESQVEPSRRAPGGGPAGPGGVGGARAGGGAEAQAGPGGAPASVGGAGGSDGAGAEAAEPGGRTEVVAAAVRDRSGAGGVLVARELGPAEVAELTLGDGGVRAIALVAGAATSHATIVARSYGVPMVVGLGAELLSVRPGAPIVVDGDAGEVVVAPDPARVRAAEVAMRRAAHPPARAVRGWRPVRARDGRIVRLLCNAARADEVVAGLAAGAEGVGLLRTELAFLAATGWPSEAEHLAALAPVLAPLSGLVATVRTLDFGADKTPPFLRGVAERGVALTLRHPGALLAQLRAIARAGAATRLRVKLPLVEDAEQVAAGRRLLTEALAAVGWSAATPPLLGASVETPAAVERIEEIAAASDFLSIGTNDLAAYALGQDRMQPLAAVRAAGDPRVLALIRRVVAAARAHGLSVEVCGEAAGDPELAGRLVEAGVDELSMAPPRLDAVRAAIRRVTVR